MGLASKKVQNDFLKLQKQGARLILDKPVIGSNSRDMFSALKWLPFQYRNKYHLAITAFKVMNKLLPTSICNLFTTAKDTKKNHELRSNSNNDFYKDRRHPKSIVTKIIKEWNYLPPTIEEMKTLDTFKHHLKKHLNMLYASS